MHVCVRARAAVRVRARLFMKLARAVGAGGQAVHVVAARAIRETSSHENSVIGYLPPSPRR
ncbi:MAG: hypothetical protein LM577_07160 [Thermoproteaceae archaeon]|nr:hypothetical protein [Thermoproteaceae archaeon]